MVTEEQFKTLIDPLAGHLGYQLRRASLTYLGALTQAIEALELKITEGTFLMFVAANPGCSQGEISRALGVKRTNMVPTVNALVKRGIVTREAIDGRTNALTLTDAGATLHTALFEAIERCEQNFFENLAPEAAKVLSQALADIRSRAADQDN